MLQVLTTSMPASSRTSTSSQRLARSEPGAFVCASSSTRATVGMPGQDRVGVHLLDDDAAILDPPARDDLEPVEQLLGLRPAVRLDEADDEVRAARGPAMALLEHPVGLADAGRHPEVDPQPATLALAARGADPGQHLLGGRAAVRIVSRSLVGHAWLGLSHIVRQQAVEVEVEEQDVDPRLAEEAEERLLGVAGDDRPDVRPRTCRAPWRRARPGTRPRPG